MEKTLNEDKSSRQGTEDRDLVEAVRAGDPTAYRGLVERYQSRIYALMCGMVKDREEARDLTQEVFIKAYNHLDRFRLESSFYTWIYRIGMNLAIDHLRKFSKRRSDEYDDGIASRSSDGSIGDAHRTGDPGRSLERKQLNETIMSALQKLSPDHRQVILLREVEGLSYKEIADSLEIAEGTVMSRLYYARRKLQQILKPQLARN